MKSKTRTWRNFPSALLPLGALLVAISVLGYTAAHGQNVEARSEKKNKADLSNRPIGDGYSSPHPGQGLKIRERTFSPSDRSNPCDTPAVRATAGLKAEQSQVEVRVGEPFSFNDLHVTAVDAAGRVVGEVPVKIDIKETVALDLETYKLTGTSIRALEPGTFDVVVGFRCREADHPVVIHYTVK